MVRISEGGIVTIKEVAELAGVSSAAVSHYLNDGYLADDKRERIRQAIERTGYAPSAQARALRTGSTRIVGVIVPKINSESISRITAGISQVLRERGHQMLLANTDNHAERELEYLELFQGHPVDGIVLVATILTPRHRAFLREAKVPVVLVGQRARGFNCVYHDDAGAARDLGRHVAEQAGPSGRVAYLGVTREDRAAGAIHAIAERFGGLAAHGAPRVSGFGDDRFLRAVTGGIPTVHLGYMTSGIKATQMLMGIIDGETTVAMQMELGYQLVGV